MALAPVAKPVAAGGHRHHSLLRGCFVLHAEPENADAEAAQDPEQTPVPGLALLDRELDAPEYDDRVSHADGEREALREARAHATDERVQYECQDRDPESGANEHQAFLATIIHVPKILIPEPTVE
jgi:hypothetical protein